MTVGFLVSFIAQVATMIVTLMNLLREFASHLPMRLTSHGRPADHAYTYATQLSSHGLASWACASRPSLRRCWSQSGLPRCVPFHPRVTGLARRSCVLTAHTCTPTDALRGVRPRLHCTERARPAADDRAAHHQGAALGRSRVFPRTSLCHQPTTSMTGKTDYMRLKCACKEHHLIPHPQPHLRCPLPPVAHLPRRFVRPVTSWPHLLLSAMSNTLNAASSGR